MAPLLKLLPWRNPPTRQEQEDLSELVHQLDQNQAELDGAARNLDQARQEYHAALLSLEKAAARRSRTGRELCQTTAGARIWSQWTKAHRWGRHYNDAVFDVTG